MKITKEIYTENIICLNELSIILKDLGRYDWDKEDNRIEISSELYTDYKPLFDNFSVIKSEDKSNKLIITEKLLVDSSLIKQFNELFSKIDELKKEGSVLENITKEYINVLEKIEYMFDIKLNYCENKYCENKNHITLSYLRFKEEKLNRARCKYLYSEIFKLGISFNSDPPLDKIDQKQLDIILKYFKNFEKTKQELKDNNLNYMLDNNLICDECKWALLEMFDERYSRFDENRKYRLFKKIENANELCDTCKKKYDKIIETCEKYNIKTLDKKTIENKKTEYNKEIEELNKKIKAIENLIIK